MEIKDVHHLHQLLQQSLAIELQICIAKIGPLPDELGPTVREALKMTNMTLALRVGIALEACLNSNSYSPLMKVLS